jgi:hypothetical protein
LPISTQSKGVCSPRVHFGPSRKRLFSSRRQFLQNQCQFQHPPSTRLATNTDRNHPVRGWRPTRYIRHIEERCSWSEGEPRPFSLINWTNSHSFSSRLLFPLHSFLSSHSHKDGLKGLLFFCHSPNRLAEHVAQRLVAPRARSSLPIGFHWMIVACI